MQVGDLVRHRHAKYGYGDGKFHLVLSASDRSLLGDDPNFWIQLEPTANTKEEAGYSNAWVSSKDYEVVNESR